MPAPANLSSDSQMLPSSWVKRIFQRMAAMYGAKYVQLWGGVPEETMMTLWAEELAGYSSDEISTGLAACRTHDWPPTLPEFLKLCRPWMNPEVAYHEAVHGMSCRRGGEMGQWSHPAIYWAAVATGTHDLLNSTYSTMKARWERAFSEELAKGHWPAVPEVREALPAPGQTVATKQEAEKALKRMGADKALCQTGRDGRRWIDKWDERIARGEHPPHAIAQMLKRAKGETQEVTA